MHEPEEQRQVVELAVLDALVLVSSEVAAGLAPQIEVKCIDLRSDQSEPVPQVEQG